MRHRRFFLIVAGILIMFETGLYLTLSLSFPVNRHPYCSVPAPVTYELAPPKKVHLMLDVPHPMLIGHSYRFKVFLVSEDTALTLAEALVGKADKTTNHIRNTLSLFAIFGQTTDSGKFMPAYLDLGRRMSLNGRSAVEAWNVTLGWQRAIHLSAFIRWIAHNESSGLYLDRTGIIWEEWGMVCVP